eukprot:scaffold45429_cov234-Skeletonema_marinoi.AAC.2
MASSEQSANNGNENAKQSGSNWVWMVVTRMAPASFSSECSACGDSSYSRSVASAHLYAFFIAAPLFS